LQWALLSFITFASASATASFATENATDQDQQQGQQPPELCDIECRHQDHLPSVSTDEGRHEKDTTGVKNENLWV
jgi:hypothetical protein